MANTHLIWSDKFGTEIMDELLANDVRNQLQSDIYRLEWKRCNSANCYSTFTTVTIGNDEFSMYAFRSYETVVAFFYNGIIYKVGRYTNGNGEYSRTTPAQISRYFKNKVLRGFHIIDEIYYDKLS